jgi:hypothetical protein
MTCLCWHQFSFRLQACNSPCNDPLMDYCILSLLCLLFLDPRLDTAPADCRDNVAVLSPRTVIEHMYHCHQDSPAGSMIASIPGVFPLKLAGVRVFRILICKHRTCTSKTNGQRNEHTYCKLRPIWNPSGLNIAGRDSLFVIVISGDLSA